MQSSSTPVRVAAISAGLADDQLEKYLAAEVASTEAAAAARRCSTRRLLQLVADPRWEVRAAAVNTLSQPGHGEIPLEQLRRQSSSAFLGERVAAVELLRRLGDTHWLQVHLERA